MGSPRHPTNMENLPGEVLSDIFIRLLARQLAQMRCVCKPWNALISKSSFVKSHLHHSIHSNDEILLFFRYDFSLDLSSLTARPSCSPDRELTNFIKLPTYHHPKSSSLGIIGSVNGLICFNYKSYDCDYTVYVWNPSLSAMLTLPPCSGPTHSSNENHFGFGFAPKTDDYKIVKLTSLLRAPNLVTQVEVYSMRKGSWQLISQRFPSHVTLNSTRDKVCTDGHDGHLHWLGFIIDLEWKVPTIVAFDLGVETFRVIPLPGSVLAYQGRCLNVLGVLSGKLCVMSRTDNFQSEVWVLDEYRVAASWVKHHAFSQFGGEILPYGFTSHGEFLFHDFGDYFALYDPVEGKAKTFKIMGGEVSRIKVVEYVDSLVWVASLSFNIEEASHQLHFFYLLLLLLCMMLCFLISFLSSVNF